MEKVKLFPSLTEASRVIPAGQKKNIQVSGKKYCLIHTKNNEWVATQAHCPHLDYPLVEGHLNGFNEIVCPWHGYRFNLSTGRECQGRGQELKTYPVQISEDGSLVLLLF